MPILVADMKWLHHAYNVHGIGAKHRSIPFLLTFDEWLSIWRDSGHLHERGRRSDQYVMARLGDIGPYAVGNVKIVTQRENKSEAHRGKTISPHHRMAIIKANTGSKRSPETRQKMRDSYQFWLARTKNSSWMISAGC